MSLSRTDGRAATCIVAALAYEREAIADWHNVSAEVERAIDNLMKSGKFFPGPRRDMGSMGSSRQYSDMGKYPVL